MYSNSITDGIKFQHVNYQTTNK